MKKTLSFVLFISLTVMFLFVPASKMFASEKKMVNINTASKKELTVLKGIGEKTAQKIIDYRKANGPFKTTDELKNVKGIGKKIYEGLKNQITVGTVPGSSDLKGSDKKGSSKKTDEKKTTEKKSTK